MLIHSIAKNIKYVLIFLAFMLFLVISLVAWIMQEPRSFEWLKGYIEKELSNNIQQFDVTIDKGFITWDGFDNSIVISLSKVNLLQEPSQEILATFDKVSLGISALSLLKGNFAFDEANIIKPNFYLNIVGVNASQPTPTKDWLQNMSPVFNFLSNEKNFGQSGLPEHLRVTDGMIHINNGTSLFTWQLPQAYLLATEEEIQGAFTLDFGNSLSVFSLSTKRFMLDVKPEIIISTENFPSYILADLIPDVDILKNIDLVFSTRLAITLDEQNEPDVAAITISNTKGNIDLKEYFPDILSLQSLDLDATYQLNNKLLTITALEAGFPDVTFKGSGMLQNLATWNEPELVMDTELNIHNVKTDLLQLYWPIPLGNQARTWVATNLRSGKVPHAHGRFIIKEGEYGIAPMPKHFVNATVNFEDVKLQLPSPLSTITNAKGQAYFDGKHMKVDVSSALHKKSSIKNAEVIIPDWKAEPDLTIAIKGDVEGAANDLVELAKAYVPASPKNEQKQIFSLHSFQEVKGNASTKVDISFPLKSDLLLLDMKLGIESTLNDASINNILNQQAAKNIKAVVTLSNEDVNIKGSAKLGDAAITAATLAYPFDEAKPINFNAKVDSSIAYLASLVGENNISDAISGNILFDVKGSAQHNNVNLSGTADAKNAVIKVDEISFQKAANVPLTITFDLKKSADNRITLPKLSAKNDILTFDGNLALNAKQQLTELILKNLSFNRHNLSLVSFNQAKKLTLRGKQLDLNDIDIEALTEPSGEANTNNKFSLDADIENLFYKNDSHFKQVKATLSCAESRCQTVDIYGRMADDKFLVVNLKPTGDKYTLLVESDDAGALLNAFDISDKLKNGRLNIQAVLNYQDDLTEADGTVEIEKFTVQNTPLLGKLFTLASFKGIGDLLQGQGIKFNRFHAPFIYQNGVITVKDAKSSGSSIGITAKGTIDTNVKQLNLEGTLIPAQDVNNIVTSIPVVGDIITADGKYNIIAANYSVKGPFSDAKPSVNPLSIMTPGILKKVFEIFPDSTPKPAATPAPSKPKEIPPSSDVNEPVSAPLAQE